LQKEEARARASRKNAGRYNARGVKKWRGVPEEEKLKKFCDVERPHTKEDLCNFLESARYFRKFIPEFATTALPLTDKTKEGRLDVIVWDAKSEAAFKVLKQRLGKREMLTTEAGSLTDVTSTFDLCSIGEVRDRK
jgi:hypothetical protein